VTGVPADVQPVIVQSPPATADQLISAVIALLVGAGLGLAAHEGTGLLILPVIIAQAIIIVTWVSGPASASRIGELIIGALAAVSSDIVIAHWPHGQLSPLLAVVGLALPAMFIHQLSRGVVRARVTESLSDVTLLVVSVVGLAALIQLRHETGGTAMASAVGFVAGGAVAVGHLIDAWWAVPRFDGTVPRGLIGVIAGIVVAAVLGYLRLNDTAEFSPGRAVFLGAGVGAVVSLLAVALAFVRSSSTAPSGAVRYLGLGYSVVIPFGLVAPVGYLLCLAVRG
jgi:hypothetical protein